MLIIVKIIPTRRAIDKRYTNGFTEGTNNKIKVIKRNAFGYKNFNFFRKRILYIFNKKISDIDKAIEILLYIMKKQIFIDGNKRTSIIFANHYLISKGKGIIVIPAELTDEYKDLLINYYEGKDKTKIKKFLKEKCFMKI